MCFCVSFSMWLYKSVRGVFIEQPACLNGQSTGSGSLAVVRDGFTFDVSCTAYVTACQWILGACFIVTVSAKSNGCICIPFATVFTFVWAIDTFLFVTRQVLALHILTKSLLKSSLCPSPSTLTGVCGRPQVKDGAERAYPAMTIRRIARTNEI